ncbi:MAG: hypothetical protein AB7U83_17755 [Vicinamibacterales bacterium]
MMRLLRERFAMVAAASLLAAGPAAADIWTERTTLRFSAPVQIPGATLEPGAYVFRLLDPATSRDVVEVSRENGDVVTITQAVPVKRTDLTTDTVLRFSPTSNAAPPAIRAWFYPGSAYGHRFVYPEDQARLIANRTRTVVLATDQVDADVTSGRLVIYDADGAASAWQNDEAVLTEWAAWQRERAARADHPAAATARAVADRTDSTAATRVALDDIEDEPMRFLGQTVRVDAEVEKVFGPRLFTIDEPDWIDFDGETLVHAPTAMAALVRPGDLVTVTATVTRFAAADVEHEWGWVGLDPDTADEHANRPLLEATRIVGGSDGMVLLIDVDERRAMVAGTRRDEPVITAGHEIANGGEELIGRRVRLRGVAVAALADDGFYAMTAGPSVFVLPSDPAGGDVAAGDLVTIEGLVLPSPRHMAPAGDQGQDTNGEVYVLATTVER